jgi:hypothetical protein
MNLTTEQIQIASMTDAKMQRLVCDGNDDLTILEMFDYMPGFKWLMDTSESDTMTSCAGGSPDFFTTLKSLKR